MTTHDRSNGGTPWAVVRRPTVAFPSAAETHEPAPLPQEAARAIDRSYRERLIRLGALRPDAPARESTWLAALPFLPRF